MRPKIDRKKKLVLIASLGLFVVLSSKPLLAAGEDPLVSLSYFNQQIEILKKELGSKGSSEGGQAQGLEIVNVKSGSRLVGAQGTEMILRSGEAQTIGSDLGGLSDVTQGRDIPHGNRVESNHQLIIPRSDGRGIRAKTDIIVMVRGSYSILEGR